MHISATPTEQSLPFRPADFATLTEALDYAAQGETGCNFFNGRGRIYDRLSYRKLREQARALARQLLGLGLARGDRVALVAETDPHFVRFFYACQYAGLIPVALPASVKIGAHEAYVAQLHRLLEASDANVAVASEGYLGFLKEAGEGLSVRMVATPEAFYALEEPALELPTIEAGDIAYLQYTSGSTRFPRGVIIRHQTAMANLHGIVAHGLHITGKDRLMSWLPFYHDMGLVGFVLTPVAAQISVDYLDTREFAMRPRQWLKMMTQSKATIAFAPSFGYDLCARRVRPGDIAEYDLSHWRVAGIGAEMIRPQTLQHFADILEPAGFDRRAFVACYGMAECTLGVSFSPLWQGFSTHYIDSDHLSDQHEAVLMDTGETEGRGRHFVNCGVPLPSFEVEVRDDDGNALADWQSGVIHLRGPSVMSGYFNLPEETSDALCGGGWLNTGDIGYLADGMLTITGRKKDLIIIHGRNIWPQDLEHLAETQPEVRVGDALAFSAPDHEGEEMCVLVVQCRERDPNRRHSLVRRLTAIVRTELGLDCYVELVPPHSLPRTSSGKLSRAKARLDFIAAHDEERLNAVAEELRVRVATA
ncbi:fatty acyl-AMP ligase [Pseudohaliea rubra]|uniref:Long-chain-fatty-acid--CoA ligase n=1 Tax=Pseudohaliea rubra DSM 19751 TaxID=1265313 RepID=A0A095VSA2_9GAMM|nr:fatty acyl-AMP ligase [Pseudohaliea rubra]KGE03968.1 Long-chain-fatty-acid--CoA ligase [Pseudohaliea rubra DSM 19751]